MSKKKKEKKVWKWQNTKLYYNWWCSLRCNSLRKSHYKFPKPSFHSRPYSYYIRTFSSDLNANLCKLDNGHLRTKNVVSFQKRLVTALMWTLCLCASKVSFIGTISDIHSMVKNVSRHSIKKYKEIRDTCGTLKQNISL